MKDYLVVPQLDVSWITKLMKGRIFNYYNLKPKSASNDSYCLVANDAK